MIELPRATVTLSQFVFAFEMNQCRFLVQYENARSLIPVQFLQYVVTYSISIINVQLAENGMCNQRKCPRSLQQTACRLQNY